MFFDLQTKILDGAQSAERDAQRFRFEHIFSVRAVLRIFRPFFARADGLLCSGERGRFSRFVRGVVEAVFLRQRVFCRFFPAAALGFSRRHFPGNQFSERGEIVFIPELFEFGAVFKDDDADEDESIDDVLQGGEVAREIFGKLGVYPRNEHRGNDGAVDASHSAEHDHHEDIDGIIIIESIALENVLGVAEQDARHAGEKRGDNEYAQFIIGDVDAHGAGGDFVVADGGDRPALLASHEILHHEHRHQHHRKADHEQIVQGIALYLKTDRAAERFGVLKDRLDDLSEREGDDGEIVPFQSERGQTDDKSEHRRHQAADQHRQEEGYEWRGGGQPRIDIVLHIAADIGSQPHKRRVPQGKLAEETDYEIERKREDDAVRYLFQKELIRALQLIGEGQDGKENSRPRHHHVIDAALYAESGFYIFQISG